MYSKLYLLLQTYWNVVTSHNKTREKTQEKSKMDMEIKSVKKEILFDGRFYDVTDFVKRHPGGRIIEFYVNNDEDATEAIKQFHFRWDSKTPTILKSFESRPSTTKKIRNYEALSEDFEKLFQEVRAEGLFEPSFTHSFSRVVEIIMEGLVGSYLIVNSQNIFTTCLGILIFALFSLRGGLMAHETGHYSAFGNPKVDRLLIDILYGLTNGLSGSWWINQHNRHHAMPQRLKHDVDMNTYPFAAYHADCVKEKPLTWPIRHQAILAFPILATVQVLRWKMHVHPKYIILNGHYRELFLFAIHYLIAYQIGLAPYFFAMICTASFSGLTFILGHSHLPVTNEPRHWVEYSLVHTMNFQSNWFLDWCTGYLNFQIEHHLFPAMPQFRHAQIKRKVQAMAEKHNLPYVCVSYWEAVRRVFANLSNVSLELEKLEKDRLLNVERNILS